MLLGWRYHNQKTKDKQLCKRVTWEHSEPKQKFTGKAFLRTAFIKSFSSNADCLKHFDMANNIQPLVSFQISSLKLFFTNAH